MTKRLKDKTGVTVRHYLPDEDLQQVEQICKNVYGGTDALPRLINMYATQPNTSVFVAENDSPQILALVCLQLRGDTVWVWGARTLEAARQQGLATLLMNHAEHHARCLPSARWMLSTTIPTNTTMCKLFVRLGYCQQACVIVWPSAPLTQQALERIALGGSSSVSSSDGGGGGEVARARPALLDCAPRCLEAELGAVPGSKDLLEQWEPCPSVDQLLSIHARLREERMTGMRQDEERDGEVQDSRQLGASASKRGFLPTGREGVVAWLPLDYKVLPVEGDAARGMIKEGHLWVLPPSPPPSAQTPPSPDTHAEGPDCSTPGAAHAGVLLVSYSMDDRLWFAGIVAGSEAVLAAAVLKALEVQPLCVRFYIDRCDRYEGPRCLQRLEHQDSDCLGVGGEQLASYLVYHKEL